METKAIACNLPHGVLRIRLGGQQEVLVEVVLFVSIKLHSSAGHNENCGLGLSSLLFTHIKEKKKEKRSQFLSINRFSGLNYNAYNLTQQKSFINFLDLEHNLEPVLSKSRKLNNHFKAD